MKRLLIIALLALPLSIQAQRIHAYVTSGVTMSQIEGDELKGFKKVGFNGGVGALTAISHNGRWGLSLEAMYAQRGAYNGTGDPYSIKLTLDYIEIPLLVHFQDPYGGMLFGVGLDYGRLVQQPHNIMQYNPNYFMPDTVDFSFLSDDLSVVADARFTIWRGLQLDIRWQHSLMAVKRQWNFSEYRQGRWYHWDNNCYNHSLTFRLIYQF